MRAPRCLLVSLALVVLPACAHAQQADHPGKAVYDRWCAACHGVDGAGEGVAAAYMLPRPRDFTRGVYQIRTTANGELPTDDDLRRVIDDGVIGTAMPGWRSTLTQAERTAVLEYIKTFSAFFAQGPAPAPLDFGRPSRASDEAIEEGRQFYDSIECWKCHGTNGRGDGASAPTQEDDEGYPIRPADLSKPWRFNGGASVEEIYRRLRTGVDGTPMPSFSDLIDAGFLTDEQLWNVAHFVRSLGPEQAPEVREVVRAARVETLPAGVDDPAWEDVEAFFIPLVGQVIERGRWFAPSVSDVWVQALHDGRELALRLVWNDPSRSPAAEWAEWRAHVETVMEPKEAAAPAGPLPDAIAVQFPRTPTIGMERPYFLMGSARDPVYLWHWQSAPEAVSERIGRGLARTETIASPAAPLTGAATFDTGQWRLLLRRALDVSSDTSATADPRTAQRLDFPTAQAIPFALFAWDGDNGEAETRAAISTWYFVYLQEPTSPVVYAAPLMAVLLTAVLGLFAVRRAQRQSTLDVRPSGGAPPQAVPAGARAD
jgi:DMSO reductase family type II enzyme heme b subunit